MPLHRNIELLVPEMQKKVLELVKRLVELNIPFYISETYRDQDVQDAYYSQGRRAVNIVNELRDKAGLHPISVKDNLKPITQVRVSQHTSGKAIDIVGMVNGQPTWNMPDSFWKTIADEAVKLGLDAGYYWKDWQDKPHIQLL